MNVYPRIRWSVAVAATAAIAFSVTAQSSFPARAAEGRVTAAVIDEVLTIVGTAGADRITVDYSAGATVVVDLGNHAAPLRLARDTFESVTVTLKEGDDDLRTITGGAAVDAPMTLSAGAGNDAVVGGGANDVLRGNTGEDLLLGGAGEDRVVAGPGADDVNGGIGTDVERLGRGADTAGWNPGEGNDIVDGGFGTDSLIFNGSDGDEQFTLSAEGETAVLLRNPGNIRMDLDSVERLSVATFGGVDTIVADDLTGTALTASRIDLAATTGAGDAAMDSITVTGTDGADKIAVSGKDGAVTVAGLSNTVLIAGGEPADRLTIDALEGRDDVVVSNRARRLLEIVATDAS